MILFVRNVPKSLSRKALKSAIQDTLKPAIRLPFLRVSTVTKARFLVIHDKDTGGIERHGLVTVRTGGMGDATQRKFRHVRLDGRLCTVRPYFKRRVQRDRRIAGNGAWDSEHEQRNHERRRRNIEAGIEWQPYVHGLNIGFKL